MHYRNLTLAPGANITTNGRRIFVAGVLDLTNAPANAVTASGDEAITAAFPRSGSVSGTLAATLRSGTGGTPRVFSATRGAFGLFTVVGVGGGGGIPGSGGGGVRGGRGGAGGAGGGFVWIAARSIVRGPGTAPGALSADGAPGEPGGVGLNGGGGGAGGGGGSVLVAFETLAGTVAPGVCSAAGGGGGPGGAASAGVAGASGARGADGRVVLLDMTARSITLGNAGGGI